MNVLYVGVNNPLTIKVDGIPDNELKVACVGANLRRKSPSKYNIQIARPHVEIKVIVSHKNKALKTIKFRSKPIPNAVPQLGRLPRKTNEYEATEFKAQKGLAMVLELFDFEARCKTKSYRVTRISVKGRRTIELNQGATFNPNVEKLINQATTNDIYIFDKIISACPGDRNNGRETHTSIVAYIK